VTRVAFHPEAEAEFLAAARFYEAHAAGLGLDFVAEVRTAMRYPPPDASNSEGAVGIDRMSPQ
jgi:hypothetical protein